MIDVQFKTVGPGGKVSPMRITVGAPKKSRGAWACAVGMSRLGRVRIIGEDSLQAVSLSLAYVDTMLRAVERQGRRITFATGERVPLSAYFRIAEVQRRLAKRPSRKSK